MWVCEGARVERGDVCEGVCELERIHEMRVRRREKGEMRGRS